MGAMAESGRGRTAQATLLRCWGGGGDHSQSVAPTRAKLIRKGMVWSPSHGDTAFTVPLFDAFMWRIMPGSDGSRSGLSRARDVGLSLHTFFSLVG